MVGGDHHPVPELVLPEFGGIREPKLRGQLATQELRLRELLGIQEPMVMQERKLRGSVPLVLASSQRGMPRDLRPPSLVFQG